MTGNDLDLIKILLESGIVVKGVLLLLVLCSVASWAIVLSRKGFFSKLEQKNNLFLSQYREADMFNLDVSGKEHSCYDEILYEGNKELNKIKDSLGEGVTLADYFARYGTGSLERSLRKANIKVSSSAEKYLSTLASIASVSPFIGLFGTVWGIINSFQGLAGGGMTLAKVAPGIAEALVATAVGLAAAIPAGWFFNKYSNKIQEVDSEMEKFAMDYINESVRKSLS